MAGAKKFGTFGGVFTPSILTILGVIMYMRLGWVVGNAGLYGTIIIILIAHVISITTGLSISSIATDKKVGAGGVYYVLSRSLGLPIGGAIGTTLFAGTALSIALYLIGFAESFNSYIGIDTSINGLRIGGTIALIALCTIAIISTAVAIKAQYFIMGAIVISLFSIVFGSWEFAPAIVPSFGGEGSVPMETVFAIFFPAVTGFTAGIAMSGDLKDPKKSIPVGTIAAITVGLIIYISLAVFIAYAIDPATLTSDYNILMKIAVFAPAVAAGIWGATLSSALGGILGGPRILQAMSVDKITPKIFGKGVGKDNEPRNALLVTFIIAECGVLIGELDLVARIVSMFYLSAYGFINLSFFLESWASADFNPSFKVKRWVGLIGFVATFAVMFRLDMMAMFAAFIVIGGIYAYLQRKELALGSGDIWHSVWSSLVLTGLKKMDKRDDVKRNWIPNILLFSGTVETRPHLIEIAKGIAGKVGMVSNFHLIENPDAQVLFPKHKQSLHDPILIKNGIFGRQLEVQNIFKGIETIASTYGFSGVEPNTVLLGWAKNTKDPLWFAQMTQKLIDLDYNVLYLDYDWNKKFGKYQRIDIWWRNLKNNAELTLNIAKFISQSPEWEKASIRLLLINDTNKEGFERKIHQQLDLFRIDATVKVINNYLEKKSSFELMKKNSLDADLIIAGIPDIPSGEEKDFVDNTTEMFGVLGTTLMVKTSSVLGEDESEGEIVAPSLLAQDATHHPVELIQLREPTHAENQEWMQVMVQEIEDQSNDLVTSEIASFQNIFGALIQECQMDALQLAEAHYASLKDTSTTSTPSNIRALQKNILDMYLAKVERFENEDLPYLEEKLAIIYDKYAQIKNRVLQVIPEKIKIDGSKMALRKLAKKQFDEQYQMDVQAIQYQIGYIGFQLNEEIKYYLLESVRIIADNPDSEEKTILHINETFSELLIVFKNKYIFLNAEIRNNGRLFINSFLQKIENPTEYRKENNQNMTRKSIKNQMLENAAYQDYWHQNQIKHTNRLATDLKLQQIKLILEQIGDNIQKEMNGSMFENTKQRLHEANEWWHELEINPVQNVTDAPEVNLSLSYDDRVIEELMSLAETSGEILPEQLELIEPDSLHNLARVQGDEVESLIIDSIATYKYLIYSNLQQPIQKLLLSAYQSCMQMLSKVQYDINSIIQKMNYAKEGIDKDELKSLARQAKENIATLQQQLQNKKAHKNEILHDIIHTSNSSLNTASLMEHAIRILPNKNTNSSKKGIEKWLGNAGEKAGSLFNQWSDLVTSQSVLITTPQSQSEVNGSVGVDVHYELKQFINDLTTDKNLEDNLPFYYKQIFVGKQVAALDQLYFREKELEQALSMLKSPNTDEHAIIVLGEPLSGKSLFSEVVVKQMKANNVIKIQPPINGSTNPIDLISILQKHLKSTTKSSNIVKEAPLGTVFLLEDLELWWDRGNPDGILIRKIVKLINQNKSQYFFILNCNLYAFKIMEAQGLLDALTASRVYLSNFDQPAIQNLLLERHRAGGLSFRLRGKDESDMAKKDIRKLMAKYWKSSNGIVGAALQQWISNIKSYHDDEIEIDFPGNKSLPQFEDKEWLIILSQFLIHKHLDARRLHKLFDYEDRGRSELIISQLCADGIIQDLMGRTYKLHPLAVVWVINRAREFSLI